MTHKRRQHRPAVCAKGFVPYKRRQGEQLGAVGPSDVKAVAEIFGIENNKFLWGRTNNQQSLGTCLNSSQVYKEWFPEPAKKERKRVL